MEKGWGEEGATKLWWTKQKVEERIVAGILFRLAAMAAERSEHDVTPPSRSFALGPGTGVLVTARAGRV